MSSTRVRRPGWFSCVVLGDGDGACLGFELRPLDVGGKSDGGGGGSDDRGDNGGGGGDGGDDGGGDVGDGCGDGGGDHLYMNSAQLDVTNSQHRGFYRETWPR